MQNGVNGGDNSLTGATIMAGMLAALNYAVTFVTSRSRSAEKLVEGVPVVLARDGRVSMQVLQRELISEDDFREALRMYNLADVADVALALLEINSSISVVPKPRG